MNIYNRLTNSTSNIYESISDSLSTYKSPLLKDLILPPRDEPLVYTAINSLFLTMTVSLYAGKFVPAFQNIAIKLLTATGFGVAQIVYDQIGINPQISNSAENNYFQYYNLDQFQNKKICKMEDQPYLDSIFIQTSDIINDMFNGSLSTYKSPLLQDLILPPRDEPLVQTAINSLFLTMTVSLYAGEFVPAFQNIAIRLLTATIFGAAQIVYDQIGINTQISNSAENNYFQYYNLYQFQNKEICKMEDQPYLDSIFIQTSDIINDMFCAGTIENVLLQDFLTPTM